MKTFKTLLTTSLLLSFMIFFVSATTSRDDGRKSDNKEMSKKERKRIISEDKKAIAALKSRATLQSLPFIVDSDDPPCCGDVSTRFTITLSCAPLSSMGLL